MAEYIERAAVEKMLEDAQLISDGEYCGYCTEDVSLNSIPTADVVKVKHAHWEFPVFSDSDDGLDPRAKCSECGGIEAAFARWKYCPNCGARMDKEDDHEISQP